MISQSEFIFLVLTVLHINLSELARKHGIPGTTGNMVAREFLESNGLDVKSFANNISKTRIRRHYLKLHIPFSHLKKKINNIANKYLQLLPPPPLPQLQNTYSIFLNRCTFYFCFITLNVCSGINLKDNGSML